MSVNDTSKTSGQIRVVHTRGGIILSDETFKNLITTAGKNWQAARQKTTGQPAEIGWLACGTGVAAPALGDTALGTEIARVAVAVSGGTVAANVVTYEGTFAAGVGTGALTEIGLFNAALAGTLVSRATFAVKNKEAGDTIAWTWTHTVS